MQPGGDGGGGNLIRGGGRSRGGSFIRSRGNGRGGMAGGGESAPIDEGGGYTLERNASFARSRGGGGELSVPIDQRHGGGIYGQSHGIGGRGTGSGEQSAVIDEAGGYARGRRGGGGDYGGHLGGETDRQVLGPSTSQGYGFRGGDYLRGGEVTQHQQLPSTSAVCQQSFAQSRGYGGGPRGRRPPRYCTCHPGENRLWCGHCMGHDHSEGQCRFAHCKNCGLAGHIWGTRNADTGQPEPGRDCPFNWGICRNCRNGYHNRRDCPVPDRFAEIRASGEQKLRREHEEHWTRYRFGGQADLPMMHVPWALPDPWGRTRNQPFRPGLQPRQPPPPQPPRQPAQGQEPEQQQQVPPREQEAPPPHQPAPGQEQQPEQMPVPPREPEPQEQPEQQPATVGQEHEKPVNRTEQLQIPPLPPTFHQAPAPIRQPAREVSPAYGETLGKSSFDLRQSVQQRVSAVQKPSPGEVTRSTVQNAPAPVQNAPAPVQNAPAPVQNAPAPVINTSKAEGDISTTIRNAATDEQIEELGQLVDTLTQTFARMSVLVKSFKK